MQSRMCREILHISEIKIYIFYRFVIVSFWILNMYNYLLLSNNTFGNWALIVMHFTVVHSTVSSIEISYCRIITKVYHFFSSNFPARKGKEQRKTEENEEPSQGFILSSLLLFDTCCINYMNNYVVLWQLPLPQNVKY